MLIVYLLIVFAVFPALALLGCKFAKKRQFAAVLFPKEASVYWRGIAALMVIFAHLTIYLQNKGVNASLARVYEWFGGMGVLIFFFVSGYGTALSLRNRKMDLQWLIKHLLWLWIPVAIIRCFLWFGCRSDYPSADFRTFVLFAAGFLDPAWYVNVLLTVYVTVFIAKRFFPARFLLVLFFLNLATSVLFCLLGFEPRWYNGHLLFVLGAALSMWGDTVQKTIRRHWWFSLICGAALFAAFALFFARFKPAVFSAVLKLISGAGLCFMLVVLSQKFTRYGTIMMEMGKMSLYLYIIHSGLYPIMDKLWPSEPYLVVFLSLAAAFPASILCIKLETWTRNCIQKK